MKEIVDGKLVTLGQRSIIIRLDPPATEEKKEAIKKEEKITKKAGHL